MVPCLKVLQHRGVLQCPVPVPAVALHRLHIEVGIFLRSWVNFSAIILEYFRCTSNMFILFLIYFSFENFAFHLTGATSWPWRPPLPLTCTSFSKGVLESADFLEFWLMRGPVSSAGMCWVFPHLAPSLFVDWFDLICSACKPNQSPRLRAFSRFHGGTVGPYSVFQHPKDATFQQMSTFQVEVLALGVPIPAVADPEVLRMGSQRCQWQISEDWCLNDITDSSYSNSAFFFGL